MPKTINVEIDINGKTVIQTKGFKGKSCVADAEFIKKALGTETEKTFTSEYYQPEEPNTVKQW